jgi:hypothetical protein
MKLLATAIFAGMLAFGTAACAKEEPKKEVAEINKAAAPATKQVCLDVQGKDGQPVIDPKVIRIIVAVVTIVIVTIIIYTIVIIIITRICCTCKANNPDKRYG